MMFWKGMIIYGQPLLCLCVLAQIIKLLLLGSAFVAWPWSLALLIGFNDWSTPDYLSFMDCRERNATAGARSRIRSPAIANRGKAEVTKWNGGIGR